MAAVITVVAQRPWDRSSPDTPVEAAPGDPVTGAHVRLGAFTADTKSADVTVTAQAAPLDDAARADLVTTQNLGLVTGVPVQVELDAGEFPEAGITLTRTYPEALPADTAATWMFYVPTMQAWIAYPSTLSEDRKTISATVDHLSWWTDVIGAAGDVGNSIRDSATAAGRTVVDAADAAGKQAAERIDAAVDWVGENAAAAAENLYGALTAALSVRVAPPSCGAGHPRWVLAATHPAPQVNNPIHFCASTDPRKSGVEQAKASVNRGFGFIASLTAGSDVAWTYNQTLPPAVWRFLAETVTDLPRLLGTTAEAVSAGRAHFVAPGDEFAFGVEESQTRARPGGRITLEMQPTSPVGAVTSIVGRAVISEVGAQQQPWITLLSLMADCASEVAGIENLIDAASAAGSCISGLAHGAANATYGNLVEIVDYINREAGQEIARTNWSLFRNIMKRLSLGLSLVTVAVEASDYTNTVASDRALRSVSIDARPTRTTGPSNSSDPGSWVVAPGSIGPFRIGMSAQEAVAAGIVVPYPGDECGQKWTVPAPSNPESQWLFDEWRDGDPDDLDQIVVQFNPGYTGTWPRTASGITLGSTFAEVQQAYPDLSTNSPVVEGGEVREYVTFDGRGGALVFIFTDDLSTGIAQTEVAEPDDAVMIMYATSGTSIDDYVIAQGGC